MDIEMQNPGMPFMGMGWKKGEGMPFLEVFFHTLALGLDLWV